MWAPIRTTSPIPTQTRKRSPAFYDSQPVAMDSPGINSTHKAAPGVVKFTDKPLAA